MLPRPRSREDGLPQLLIPYDGLPGILAGFGQDQRPAVGRMFGEDFIVFLLLFPAVLGIREENALLRPVMHF